jgi:hypothetical protein
MEPHSSGHWLYLQKMNLIEARLAIVRYIMHSVFIHYHQCGRIH